MATLLFATAALSVDLGNAWARKRDVQKGVDVSAIGAGWMLPMTSSNELAIANKVAEYLTDADNLALDQEVVTGSQLIDDDNGNGQIYWQHDDGTACSSDCTQMQVVAPPAKVSFGLANALGIGSTKVTRAATVRMLSELPSSRKILPLWLPNGCGYGSTEPDTEQGQPHETESPSPTATSTATSTETSTPSGPTPVGTHTLTGPAVTEVAYQSSSATISGYDISNVANQYKNVTLVAFSPTGGTVEFAAQQGAVPPFPISHSITDTVGDWRVYALAKKQNGDSAYSTGSPLIIRVTDFSQPSPTETSSTPTSTPTSTSTGADVGCIGQDRGNFGQMYSPRVGYNDGKPAFAANLALGLDHRLVPYVFPSDVDEQTGCGKKNQSVSLPGGDWDDTAGPAGDGANCIDGDTGNDGGELLEGLVTGLGNGVPGRLDVVNGHTSSKCVAAGRSDVAFAGVTINNDVLSCYLLDGHSLGDIAASEDVDDTMLSADVVKSPRFVWLPVVYATNRDEKEWQPLLRYIPGFITDETQVATLANSDSAGPGMELNGQGNSLSSIKVFVFNPDALPPNETADTTTYDPEIGGAIVRLVK